jgi:hypothetical protein
MTEKKCHSQTRQISFSLHDLRKGLGLEGDGNDGMIKCTCGFWKREQKVLKCNKAELLLSTVYDMGISAIEKSLSILFSISYHTSISL